MREKIVLIGKSYEVCRKQNYFVCNRKNLEKPSFLIWKLYTLFDPKNMLYKLSLKQNWTQMHNAWFYNETKVQWMFLISAALSSNLSPYFLEYYSISMILFQ